MLNCLSPFFFLWLYIAVMYLRPHEYVASLATVPLLPALLASAFLLWLLRGPRRLEGPQHLLLPAFLLIMALSVAAAGWLGGAIEVVRDFYPTLILFYLCAAVVNDLKRLQQVMVVLVVVTTIIAMHGIGQVDTGEGWSGARTVQGGRITYLGFLNDPNDLAVAFLTALPLAIYLAREAASMLLRWASYGAAGTTLYGIYLTNSRGGFVALLAMLGVYCFHRFGLLRTIVVGPLALVPLLIMRPSRMEDVSPDEASASERVEAWYTGLQLFFEHPILGVGRGNFTEHHWLTAHNSYILVLAETGLAGYLIWTALIGTTLVALYRVETSLADGSASASPQSGPDAQHAAAARAMLYSLVGFLAAAFFLSRSYIPILYLVLGLSVAVYQIVRQRWPSFNPVRLLPMLGRLLVLQSASIVGLWMLVRVLLAMN